jgi:predicted RNase H-like HicB family nuclease
MRYYFALVEKEEGSAYGVRFPDFPHVFSAADEQADIVKEALDALRLAAEDGPLPKPLTHAQILAREDVRAALAEGCYLVQVPFSSNDTEVVRANITLERGALEAIDFAAKQRGLTRSAFMVNSAKHEIEA